MFSCRPRGIDRPASCTRRFTPNLLHNRAEVAQALALRFNSLGYASEPTRSGITFDPPPDYAGSPPRRRAARADGAIVWKSLKAPSPRRRCRSQREALRPSRRLAAAFVETWEGLLPTHLQDVLKTVLRALLRRRNAPRPIVEGYGSTRLRTSGNRPLCAPKPLRMTCRGFDAAELPANAANLAIDAASGRRALVRWIRLPRAFSTSGSRCPRSLIELWQAKWRRALPPCRRDNAAARSTLLSRASAGR